MTSRILCGVVAMAMAGPCLAQAPANAPRPVSQVVIRQDSSYTTPSTRQPVIGLPKGSAYTNAYPHGSGCTWCGPGTQYLAGNCDVRLDLSNGIGLCDPCNCWRPHPGPNCCGGCR